MLRFLCDENLNGDIIRGLIHQNSDLDVLRVVDVGVEGVDDPAVLEWAALHCRIVLTHDRATMPNFAYARILKGLPMPGLFVVSDRMAIGVAIEELLFMISCSHQNEWLNLVVYLPL